MKRPFHLVIALLLCLVFALTACLGPSAPGGSACRKGVCVKLELSQPIRFNERVNATITVETEQDEARLQLALVFSHPRAVVAEGPNSWTIDVKAHVPVQDTVVFRYVEEGLFSIMAQAVTSREGVLVQDGVDLRVTRAGATLNPTPELKPGTPAPAVPVGTAQPTPSPAPTGKPEH